MSMSTRTIAAAAIVGSWLVHPEVRLRPVTVEFPGLTPDEVASQFRARLADHPDVLAADADRVVARFSGRAGPLPYRTVEVVGLSDRAITFEHLSGPFRRCEEAFELRRTDRGTAVTHVGTFTMPGGLLGWLGGQLWIRGLFEAHVAAELERMAASSLL
jgi:hypothetical protein